MTGNAKNIFFQKAKCSTTSVGQSDDAPFIKGHPAILCSWETINRANPKRDIMDIEKRINRINMLFENFPIVKIFSFFIIAHPIFFYKK